MPIVHANHVQKAGTSEAVIASPLGMPDAPRTVGPVGLVAHVLPHGADPGALPVDADVRPHPHIGLVAASVILEGAVTHRDSLRNRAELLPGSVGWTIAGRGVVHSERLERLRVLGGRLSMLQILLALPDGSEDIEPSFVHVAADQVPTAAFGGGHVRTLAGEGTPAGFPGDLLLLDLRFDGPGSFTVRPAEQRAIYVLSGSVRVGGAEVAQRCTAELALGEDELVAEGPAHVLVFGGRAVGERTLWWNFLHSSRARIEEARARWRDGGFDLPAGDTESFTPSPPDDGRPWVVLNRGHAHRG